MPGLKGFQKFGQQSGITGIQQVVEPGQPLVMTPFDFANPSTGESVSEGLVGTLANCMAKQAGNASRARPNSCVRVRVCVGRGNCAAWEWMVTCSVGPPQREWERVVSVQHPCEHQA